MRQSLKYLALAWSFLLLNHFHSYGQVDGKAIFGTRCKTCHSIGEGRVVGPDLKDLDKRRSEEWIISFVKSPIKMINGGDETAKKLYEEFDKIPMPDHPDLSDEDVKGIISFISEESQPKAEPAAAPVVQKETKEPVEASVENSGKFYALWALVIVCCLMLGYIIYLMLKVTSLLKQGN